MLPNRGYSATNRMTRLARLILTLALLLTFAPAVGAQEAPVILVRVAPGAMYEYPRGAPATPWPSTSFSVGSFATAGMTVQTETGGASGTLSLRAVLSELFWLRSIWGIEVYVRGAPGTEFRLSWSCTDTTSASSNQRGYYALGVGAAGGDCAGDASIQVLSYSGPPSDSRTASDSSVINGFTSAKTASDPSFPGITYSYATTFSQWLDIGAASVGGSLNNGIPFVGSVQMESHISFDVTVVRSGQQPPVARIVAPHIAALNSPVLLDGLQSADPDGAIVEYRWDVENSVGGIDSFRGPAFPYAQIPYTWTSPGTYSVTLVVTDNEGQTGATTTSVLVTAMLDSDSDGVPDDVDHCPGTTLGSPVDADGCSATQRDADDDGVTDDRDQCPDTPNGVPVSATGCPCTFVLSPGAKALSPKGEDDAFSIFASDLTCRWSASTEQSWIHIDSQDGTGDGVVSYHVDPNISPTPRLGFIEAGTNTFTVTQPGLRVTLSLDGGTEFLPSWGSHTMALDEASECRSPNVWEGTRCRNPPQLVSISAAVTVTDTNGLPVPALQVNFQVLASDLQSEAGHNHLPPPLGGLGEFYSDFINAVQSSPPSCGADVNGECALTFVTPEIAGRYLVRACIYSEGTDSCGATAGPAAGVFVSIRMPGLVPLAVGPGYSLVGSTPTHRTNHYAVPTLLSYVGSLGREYQALFHQSFAVNDMSLPWGGMFDLGNDWNPDSPDLNGHRTGHFFHRTGHSVDIDKSSLPTDEHRRVLTRLARALGLVPAKERFVHYELP